MAKFFYRPFAEDGTKTPIPDDDQVSGAVSYEEGFGPDYQADLATDPDAKPIPRPEFNSLMFEVTNAIRQYQTLGFPDFITAAENGGVDFEYEIHAVVRYDSGSGFNLYASLEDNNTTLPTDNTKWAIVTFGVPTGTIIDYCNGVAAPSGYHLVDGSAVSRTTDAPLFNAITYLSNGTTTASNDVITGLTAAVVSAMFAGMHLEGTGIPAGATVVSIDSATEITISANATASGTVSLRFFPWGNGDGSTTFTLPDARRRTSIGSGSSGSAIIGNKVGQVGGQETHILDIAEMPSHTHTLHPDAWTGAKDDNGAIAGTLNVGTANDPKPPTEPTGGGGAHNNMQPSFVTYKIIKR